MERYLDEGAARLIEWMRRPREAWLRDLAVMTVSEVRAATLRPFYRAFHPVVRQSSEHNASLVYVEVVE